MAHSQRQKKRSGQFKKKHFEAKGRGQREVKGEGEKKTRSPGKQELDKPLSEVKNSSVQTSESVEKKVVHQGSETQYEDSRSYSKRMVVSNWDRYSDGMYVSLFTLLKCVSSISDREEGVAFSSETEEQLQQRLVQLLNLPSVNQDTQWKETRERTEEEEEEEDGVLSLNVVALANDLSSLPVSVRLGLSQNLLEQYGVVDSDITPPSDPLTNPPPPPAAAALEKDVKSLLLSRDSKVEMKSFDFTPPPPPPPLSITTTVTHHDPLLQETNDTDLESLLSSSDTHPSSAHTAGSDSDHTHYKSSATPTYDQTVVPPNNRSTPTEEELDDILDDLLS